MFGKRLSALRDAFGITQETVAKVLNVAQEAVSKIENEKRSLSSLEVFKLSRAFDVPIGYFFGEIEIGQLGQVYFRSSSSLIEEDKAKIPILKTIANHLYDIDEVLKLQNPGINRSYRPETERTDFIRQVAIEERRLLGFDECEPIRNLGELLISYGIKILLPVLEFSVNGLFLALNNDRFLIVINSDNPPSKRNFTLAHEYGHFLMHRGGNFQSICTGLENPDKLQFKEKTADIFSAEFLMPQKSLENIDINEESLALYMHNYSVSREALIYRLATFGKITPTQKEFFLTQFKPTEILTRLGLFPEEVSWYINSQKNKRLSLKERLKRKQLNSTEIISSDFRAAVFKAYERGLITYSKVANYLLIDESELKNVLKKKEEVYEF
jgi:Zn-dependent peptidase ImmA (M78 family)/transcriptional regulator with XRE-family HTH domain